MRPADQQDSTTKVLAAEAMQCAVNFRTHRQTERANLTEQCPLLFTSAQTASMCTQE